MTVDQYPTRRDAAAAGGAPTLHEQPSTTERSALAVHRDPSLVKPRRPGTQEEPRSKRYVRWMRPTDLVNVLGSRVALRGIDFQRELARRTQRLPYQVAAATRRGIRHRAHRLPPLSAFGGAGPTRDAGVGSALSVGRQL